MTFDTLLRSISVAGALGAALLPAGCSSPPAKAFDALTGSGGDCDDTPGRACTWANKPGSKGVFSGSGLDGLPIAETHLYFVADLTFGPDGNAYVLDWNNHRVRKVTPQGTFLTVIGTDQEGDGPPDVSDETPYNMTPGCVPTTVNLNHPTGVAFMPDGTFVLAAWHDNKIRTIDPVTGLEKVLAGNDYGSKGDGGPAWDAEFNQPKSLAIDPEGRIYLNDQKNQRIRMIDIDADRTITTVAGNGTKGYAGDGGPALDAEFAWDNGGTPDPSGALLLVGRKLYIADSLNDRIRVMDLDTKMISCVAGAGCTFDVKLSYPMDLELGPDGRLFIVERNANIVDALDLTSGVLTTVAGNGAACQRDVDCIEKGTGHDALDITLHAPYGLTFDKVGNLYIADTLNSRIVRIGGAWN